MLTTKQKILCWLWMYRDDLKPETVEALQDILEERKENKEPQPQEDIELPEVPEWKAFTHDWQTYDSKDYQIEKLTEFCQAISPIVNQLIKANKK